MKKLRPARKQADLNVYPAGWDYRRTKSIADYYDSMKDQPVLDSSVGPQGFGLVWMEIPEELVPQVRKLIARKRKTT